MAKPLYTEAELIEATGQPGERVRRALFSIRIGPMMRADGVDYYAGSVLGILNRAFKKWDGE